MYNHSLTLFFLYSGKLGLDKSNPVNHIKLNWLSVKVRGNKMLIRETNQRLK